MPIKPGDGRERHNGWRVVGASGFGVFCTAVFVFSFGVLLKPLVDEFGWSRQAVSLAFGCMTIAVSLAAPVAGHLVDRFGPRWIVAPSLLLAAAAFASLSLLTPHRWHLYLVYVAIGIASAGTSPVVYSRVVASWFDRTRGKALAVVIACIGLGAIAHPLATQALIRSFGWRTACVVLAAAIMLIGVPVVAQMVREPRGRSLGGTALQRGDFRHAVSSRIFWTLLVVVFGSTLSMNAVVVHLSALLSDRGLSARQSVVALSTMGAASLVGRLLTGWLLDRFNGTRVSFALLTIAAAGALVLADANTMAQGMFAAALIGLGTGGEVDVTPYLLSRYFGLRSLSTLYGLTWLAFGIAGAAGPILLARAFDATGSYERVLIGFAMGTLAVAALMLTLPADKVVTGSQQQISV